MCPRGKRERVYLTPIDPKCPGAGEKCRRKVSGPESLKIKGLVDFPDGASLSDIAVYRPLTIVMRLRLLHTDESKACNGPFRPVNADEA